MKFSPIEIIVPIPEGEEELLDLPLDQKERLHAIGRDIANAKSKVHTFRKKWYGTNLYPNSHNKK